MTRHRRTNGPNLAWRAALGATLALAGIAALSAPGAGAASRAHVASLRHFNVTGIVSAVASTNVKIFVEHGVVAGKSADHELLSVRVGRSRIHEARVGGRIRRGDGFSVGEVAHLSGRVYADGSSDDLYAQSSTVTPSAAIAVTGTVQETGGSLVIVDRQGFGANVGTWFDVVPVIVDDSAATITLDGTSATATQIVAGQTVVVLGTSDDDIVLASSIYAFSTPPTIVAGRLADISGTTLAIAPAGWGHYGFWGWGDDNNNGANPMNMSYPLTPTLVDAASASIVVNGVSGGTVTALTQGDFVVAVGPTGTTPLAATLVLAFDSSAVEPLFLFGHHDHGHGHDQDGGGSDQQGGGDS